MLPTFAEYALELNEKYKAAAKAGEIDEPCMYEVHFPDSPDACDAIADPFIAEI
jgi:hypothetical protein